MPPASPDLKKNSFSEPLPPAPPGSPELRTIASDPGPPTNPFVENEEVIVVKIKDGVKSKVFGQTVVVTVPDWHGMVKIRVKTGPHKGEIKSYAVEDLQKLGLETITDTADVKKVKRRNSKNIISKLDHDSFLVRSRRTPTTHR